MIKSRLEPHVRRLCIKNLKDKRVKCCASCPFQDIIEDNFSETKPLFASKQGRPRSRTTISKKDAVVAAMRAAIEHMKTCHNPPRYCKKCNDLLAKAEMLDERSKLVKEDSYDPMG